jgi:hypothetical protein
MKKGDAVGAARNRRPGSATAMDGRTSNGHARGVARHSIRAVRIFSMLRRPGETGRVAEIVTSSLAPRGTRKNTTRVGM